MLLASLTHDAVYHKFLSSPSSSSVEAKYGTYQDIFATLFEKAVDSDPARDQALYIEAYDVVQGEYPTLETLKELNGVLLTGSG